uniref:Uncharacterized protein n=1 Tax=Glossina pallidipes TaxID=7398 RepID=A0A1A9Z5T0_GLOPL
MLRIFIQSVGICTDGESIETTFCVLASAAYTTTTTAITTTYYFIVLIILIMLILYSIKFYLMQHQIIPIPILPLFHHDLFMMGSAQSNILQVLEVSNKFLMGKKEQVADYQTKTRNRVISLYSLALQSFIGPGTEEIFQAISTCMFEFLRNSI